MHNKIFEALQDLPFSTLNFSFPNHALPPYLLWCRPGGLLAHAGNH